MTPEVKRYQVLTVCGGVSWAGWTAVIGEYRWLWMAKMHAWWHVRIQNPWRIALVVDKTNP